MQTRPFRIGVVNASSRLDPARGEAIRAWAAATWPSGEVELVLHPALFEAHGHFGGDDATRARCGITPGLLRLSVGIEHIDDILADLDQALNAA